MGEVARRILGDTLLVDGVGGVIVEVERYQEDDPASHSFGGRRGRAAVMFGPPGHLYVYRSYGIHWCLNLVCEPDGVGSALLIRALEPTHGVDVMSERRGRQRDLCSGPGRLCQALGVDGSLNGVPLGGRVQVLARSRRPRIVTGPRIGITKAVARPWRFAIAGSPHCSRPFVKGAS